MTPQPMVQNTTVEPAREPAAASPSPSRGPARRIWHLVAFCSVALASLAVDLGRVHLQSHSDSYVPILASLQRWTLFYWDQARYGLLVPLIALPVTDPLYNLLLQRAILILSGLVAIPLIVRFVLPRSPWVHTGLLAIAALLSLAPHPWSFEYLADQPYGLSLVLALGALVLAETPPGTRCGVMPWRWGVSPLRLLSATVLMIAAHWVNVAAGLILLPLAAARAAGELIGSGTWCWRSLFKNTAFICAGLIAGQIMLRSYAAISGVHRGVHFAVLPPALWLGAWLATLRDSLRATGTAWPIFMLAASVLALLVASRHRGAESERARRHVALGHGLLLAGAGLAYALAMASFRWVADNGFGYRYFAPTVVMLHVAACSTVASAIACHARAARIRGTTLAALVPLAALWSYGMPSVSRVRTDVEVKSGHLSEAVLHFRCDILAGDYWTVWPTVLHASIILHERRGEGAVYGLTARARPTVPLWAGRPVGDLRVCRIASERAEAERWLRMYGLWPVEVLAERGGIELLVAGKASHGRLDSCRPGASGSRTERSASVDERARARPAWACGDPG